MKEDVIIIGGGPAGIATAIQLKRYNIDSLLFEMEEIGGLVRNAGNIENYPGFPEGISGKDFVQLLKEHVGREGIRVSHEQVERLEHNGRNFLIKTNKSAYESDIVVVASGTKPKRFEPIERLKETLKIRALYEIYPVLCVKSKVIGIVGAGDAAFDYALSLSKNNRVILLNRGNTAKALPLLLKRVKNNPNIVYYKNTVVVEISRGRNRGLLMNTNKGKIEVDYLIAAIGRTAQKDFYSSSIKKFESRLIDAGVLYLVGDVVNGKFRQASIAIGDGIRAAMKIYQKMG